MTPLSPRAVIFCFSCSDLRAHKQRSLQFEKQIDRITAGSDRHRQRGERDYAAMLADVEAKLEMEREKGESVRAAMQSGLESKEEELVILEDMIAATKRAYVTTVKNLRAMVGAPVNNGNANNASNNASGRLGPGSGRAGRGAAPDSQQQPPQSGGYAALSRRTGSASSMTSVH